MQKSEYKAGDSKHRAKNGGHAVLDSGRRPDNGGGGLRGGGENGHSRVCGWALVRGAEKTPMDFTQSGPIHRALPGQRCTDGSFIQDSLPPATMSTPPPSESSSSSSTNSPSPTTPNVELKSDPSETLAFLLQTMAAQAQAQAQAQSQAQGEFDPTQPDWSQLSAWANPQDSKFDLGTEFNFSLPMDMDLPEFDPNMAVDPSALQFSTFFDQSAFTLPHNEPSFLMPNLFSTTEDLGLQSHIEPGTGRRLSVSSSSSSSGASLSPIMEPAQVASGSPPADINLSDPASELAHRVRQMAGVTLAVPVSAQVQQLAAAGGQAKLPIPRLKQSPTPAPAPKRNAKPSPPPSDTAGSPPASSSASVASSSSPSEQALSPPSEGPQPPPTQTVIGRPKTSHTTIERRYRTNLNARITGLKQSVPALRVLEVKAGVPSPWNDIVDARGFVDGVKVARKMSKANILGKATEYIRSVATFYTACEHRS